MKYFVVSPNTLSSGRLLQTFAVADHNYSRPERVLSNEQTRVVGSVSVTVLGRIEELKMCCKCRCGCEINDLVEAYLESLDGYARSGPASVKIADHARMHGPAAYAAVRQAAARQAGGLGQLQEGDGK